MANPNIYDTSTIDTTRRRQIMTRVRSGLGCAVPASLVIGAGFGGLLLGNDGNFPFADSQTSANSEHTTTYDEQTICATVPSGGSLSETGWEMGSLAVTRGYAEFASDVQGAVQRVSGELADQNLKFTPPGTALQVTFTRQAGAKKYTQDNTSFDVPRSYPEVVDPEYDIRLCTYTVQPKQS